jgi:fructan beta-fructosidase
MAPGRIIQKLFFVHMRNPYSACLAIVFLCAVPSLLAESRTLHISRQYLNIPIGRKSEMRLFQILVAGVQQRQFAMQLAENSIDYWIFVDVSEFKGQTITISGLSDPRSPSAGASLNRIYQADKIEHAAYLYRERNRPQFHFTVKRGWSNDVNGPIFYQGQYHLFWQAFPFGVKWDTDFMYWGHAVSKDMIHWRELVPALMNDKLGSPWSGTSLVDHKDNGGWGKEALVLVYTAFDRISHKQVQCIAFSTDSGAHFSRYVGNPVIDSNRKVGSNDTRDPKVFWYEPTKHWVIVLFEKDGMSFYTSTDLKSWTWKSHFKGLHECPDFFELAIDGDANRKRWILHGGSSSYFIGNFDGERFTAESPELHYADGKNLHGDDTLYAAQSFAEMRDGRRVQMAWGRVELEGMPFNQMILFPTEFKLKSTKDGLALRATPINEIDLLREQGHSWSAQSVERVNHELRAAGSGPLDVRLQITLVGEDKLTLQYDGAPLSTIQAGDLENGSALVELLIDNSIAEIFVNQGRRYIIKEIRTTTRGRLECIVGPNTTSIDHLEICRMKSIWKP